MKKRIGIIEIGSNDTKIHVYEGNTVIYEKNITIEFKKNYEKANQILESDLKKLSNIIEKVLEYTANIHVYGCSVIRNLSQDELNSINSKLQDKYNLKIEIVTKEEEAYYTAIGCYNNIDYDKNICIFIGGGGSTELIFVKNKKIIDEKYYDFGVIDITDNLKSLKDDIPTISFDEAYNYVDNLIGEINTNADILILAGCDHLYWYNNANYQLLNNDLYSNEKQKYMIPIELSDKYDKDAFTISLDKIRAQSDNPKWFDGARAMKLITNSISHKINAKYLIPTKISMEDGIQNKLNS